MDRKVKRLSTSLFVTSNELTKDFKFKENTPTKKEIDNLVMYYKEQCRNFQVDHHNRPERAGNLCGNPDKCKGVQDT